MKRTLTYRLDLVGRRTVSTENVVEICADAARNSMENESIAVFEYRAMMNSLTFSIYSSDEFAGEFTEEMSILDAILFLENAADYAEDMTREPALRYAAMDFRSFAVAVRAAIVDLRNEWAELRRVNYERELAGGSR